jgi:hypothetical protein
MQFCERHLWSMLILTLLACAAAVFAGNPSTMKGKVEAVQPAHARAQTAAFAAR